MEKPHRAEFVINNTDCVPVPEFNERLATHIRYVVIKRELATEVVEYDHYQGYFECTTQVKGLRANQLADLLGVEQWRIKYAEYGRNRNDARAYVLKPETAIEAPREWGTWIQNTQGGRPLGSKKTEPSKYEKAMSEASSQQLGLSRLRELKAENPTRSRQIDEAVNQRLDEEPPVMPKIHWLYATDVADMVDVNNYAETLALDIADIGEEKHIYKGRHFSLHDHMLGNYTGEEIVILDNICPEGKDRVDHFNKVSLFLGKLITQKNGYEVNVGNFVFRPFRAQHIIFTALGNLSAFFEHAKSTKKYITALTTYAVFDNDKQKWEFIIDPDAKPDAKPKTIKKPKARAVASHASGSSGSSSAPTIANIKALTGEQQEQEKKNEAMTQWRKDALKNLLDL